MFAKECSTFYKAIVFVHNFCPQDRVRFPSLCGPYLFAMENCELICHAVNLPLWPLLISIYPINKVHTLTFKRVETIRTAKGWLFIKGNLKPLDQIHLPATWHSLLNLSESDECRNVSTKRASYSLLLF